MSEFSLKQNYSKILIETALTGEFDLFKSVYSLDYPISFSETIDKKSKDKQRHYALDFHFYLFDALIIGGNINLLQLVLNSDKFKDWLKNNDSKFFTIKNWFDNLYLFNQNHLLKSLELMYPFIKEELSTLTNVKPLIETLIPFGYGEVASYLLDSFVTDKNENDNKTDLSISTYKIKNEYRNRQDSDHATMIELIYKNFKFELKYVFETYFNLENFEAVDRILLLDETISESNLPMSLTVQRVKTFYIRKFPHMKKIEINKLIKKENYTTSIKQMEKKINLMNLNLI